MDANWVGLLDPHLDRRQESKKEDLKDLWKVQRSVI